MLGVENPGRS